MQHDLRELFGTRCENQRSKRLPERGDSQAEGQQRGGAGVFRAFRQLRNESLADRAGKCGKFCNKIRFFNQRGGRTNPTDAGGGGPGPYQFRLLRIGLDPEQHLLHILSGDFAQGGNRPTSSGVFPFAIGELFKRTDRCAPGFRIAGGKSGNFFHCRCALLVELADQVRELLAPNRRIFTVRPGRQKDHRQEQGGEELSSRAAVFPEQEPNTTEEEQRECPPPGLARLRLSEFQNPSLFAGRAVNLGIVTFGVVLCLGHLVSGKRKIVLGDHVAGKIAIDDRQRHFLDVVQTGLDRLLCVRLNRFGVEFVDRRTAKPKMLAHG